MLKCRDMAELVTRFLEDALPGRLRLAARLHLRFCAPCRRYFDQMRGTIRFLSDGAPPPSPPPDEDKIIAAMTASRRDDRP